MLHPKGTMSGIMTSSCAVRRKLAEKFAFATRHNAQSAIRLANSGKFGIDFTRLRDQTIKAQGRAEVAFRAFTEHVASHQCGEVTQNQRHLHLVAMTRTNRVDNE